MNNSYSTELIAGAFLDAETEARRVPPEKIEVLNANFWERFDSRTLFYDVVSLEPSRFRLFAPPIWNLNSVLQGRFAGLNPKSVVVRHFHGFDTIDVDIKSGENQNARSFFEKEFGVKVSEIDPVTFMGKRTLYTLSKDNDPL